jgi:hypothetical protein
MQIIVIADDENVYYGSPGNVQVKMLLEPGIVNPGLLNVDCFEN